MITEISMHLSLCLFPNQKIGKEICCSLPKIIEGFPVPTYDGVTDISFELMDDFNSFFASENYKLKVHSDEINFIDINYKKKTIRHFVLLIS